MQTIKPTEPTWVVAGNGADLFLPSLVEPGQEFATGQPQLEQFTDRDSFLTRLDALGIEYGEGDYVPEIREVVPDWDGFNAAILADTAFNTYYATGLSTAPAVTTSIPAALTQVESKGQSAFALVYTGFCTAVNVSSADRDSWAGIAQTCNLPVDFVNLIRG